MLLFAVALIAFGVDPADVDPADVGPVAGEAAVIDPTAPVVDDAVPVVDDSALALDPADSDVAPTSTAPTQKSKKTLRAVTPDDVVLRDAFAVGGAALGGGCLGACAPVGCAGACSLIGLVSPITGCIGAVGGAVSTEQALGNTEAGPLLLVGGGAAAGMGLGAALGIGAGIALTGAGGGDPTVNAAVGGLIGAGTLGVVLAGAGAFAGHYAVAAGFP